MDVRQFLHRLRPAGAPGAAAGGVPADRRAALEQELAPVFAALAGVEAECEQILGSARAAGAALVDESARAGARAVADAQSAVALTRSAAAQERLAAARDQSRLAQEAAEREADRISGQQRRVAPALAAAVLAELRRWPG